MARIRRNKLLEGLSGKIGNLLIKIYDYGTVVTAKPDRSNVKLSAKQREANAHFRKAVEYAQSVLQDSSKHPAYSKEFKMGKSLYHVAIADYMRKVEKPKVQ